MSNRSPNAGAEWLYSAGIEPSPLGAAVANLLDYVYAGIYHLEHPEKIDWKNPHHIIVKTYGGRLATWDFNDLTLLVLACHRMAIRMEIRPKTFRQLEIIFHQRTRDGGMSQRHPAMQEAIDRFNDSCNLPVCEPKE